MITQELDDLVAAYRILAAHGVIDAYGHVSLRSPRNPERYYLARSVAPELVTEEDLIQYDLDSNALDAEVGKSGRESVNERFIHGEIYRARPDVMCVVHNHSPSVIPFSVTGVPMRALYHMASFIGEGLPNFEIRDVRKGTDLLVKDAALGKALAATLAKKPAALMRGHGSVVVGENLPRAVGRSVYLEQSARMQMQAIALAGPGGDIAYLDDAEVQACLDHLPDAGFNMLNWGKQTDIAEVKERVGDRMCLMGNVNPLEVGVRGTPEEVREATLDVLEKGGDRGMILSVGGGTSPGMPRQNILAMLAALNEFNGKK